MHTAGPTKRTRILESWQCLSHLWPLEISMVKHRPTRPSPLICSTAETLGGSTLGLLQQNLNGHHDRATHVGREQASLHLMRIVVSPATRTGLNPNLSLTSQRVKLILNLHSYFPPNVVHCQTLAWRHYYPGLSMKCEL